MSERGKCDWQIWEKKMYFFSKHKFWGLVLIYSFSFFSFSAPLFSQAFAAEKKLGYNYEKEIIFTSKPEIGTKTQAIIDDILYSETGEPQLPIQITEKDFTLKRSPDIHFPKGTTFYRAKFGKKTYYCYQKTFNEIQITLPEGEHCFEMNSKETQFVGYQFLKPGKKKFNKSIPIDPIPITNEIITPYRFEDGGKVNIWDQSFQFSLFSIEQDGIKISIPPDRNVIQIFEMIEKSANPEAFKEIFEGLDPPEEQIVFLPFLGEEKTYAFFGLEITLYSVEDDSLVYSIDKGFSKWMAFIGDGKITAGSLLNVADNLKEK